MKTLMSSWLDVRAVPIRYNKDKFNHVLIVTLLVARSQISLENLFRLLPTFSVYSKRSHPIMRGINVTDY